MNYQPAINFKKCYLTEIAEFLRIKEPDFFDDDDSDYCDFTRWQASVERAFEYLLEHHDLHLEKTKKGHYRILPQTNWKKSCVLVLETMSGYGMFDHRVEGLNAFMRQSSVTTWRQLCESHFHWTIHWDNVYGAKSPKTVYYNNMRY